MKSENLSSVDLESSQSISRKGSLKDVLTKEILEHDFLVLNLTKGQVATKYGCSRSTIANYMKRYSIQLRAYKEVDVTVEDVCKGFKAGLTIQELMKQFNCGYTTIHKRLHAAGIHLRNYPNKINISKEELIQMFLVEGLSNKQVASKFNTSVSTIDNYIRKYDIVRDFTISNIRSFKVRKLLLDKVELSSRQRSIIIGNILGDGHMSIRDSYKTAFLQCGHCIAQKEYLEWKAFELSPFISERGIYKMTKKEAYMFDTIHYKTFNELYYLFYAPGHKIIPDNIIEYLDELVLSVWFMDDGWSDNKIKTSGLSTCSFTVEECKVLLKAIQDKWSIEGKLRFIHKKYPVLLFTKGDRIKLHQIVDPLLHPCFEYKKLLENHSSETVRKAPLIG